ncbi:unnamed protein product, partial [Iphiclides podalirius]
MVSVGKWGWSSSAANLNGSLAAKILVGTTNASASVLTDRAKSGGVVKALLQYSAYTAIVGGVQSKDP